MTLSHIRAQLQVFLIKEGNCFLFYCPALNLSSYGDSINDAKASFKTALQIFFEELIKDNNLSDELLDLGWTLKRHPSAEYTPPVFTQKDIMNLLPSYKNYEVLKTIKKKVAIPLN